MAHEPEEPRIQTAGELFDRRAWLRWAGAAPSASELRGHALYGREGCVNCHSQVVRATDDDVRRFGPASQAWETEKDFPQLWGTRRIGPDLARESGRRSRDWQLTHLWNPRWVVPESNMPAHPWLFHGSPRNPTQEALDLVAYLDSLGRDARLAGTLQRSPFRNMDPAEEKRMGVFCDCAIPRTAGPAVLLSTEMPAAELVRFELRGATLFGRALWTGVPGSTMPGWHDLPANELRALAAHVRSLEAERPPEKKTSLSADELSRAKKLSLMGRGCCC